MGASCSLSMFYIVILVSLFPFYWKLYSQPNNSKKAWTALLPSVSYSQNSGFNIGFSLSNISNFAQQKRRNEIELHRYNLQLEQARTSDSLRTADAHAKIDADLDLLLADIDVLDIYEKLALIYSGQYDNAEISTEEYLKKQISIQRARSSVLRKLKRLHLRAIKSGYPSIKILDSLLLSQDFGSGQRPVSAMKKVLKHTLYPNTLYEKSGLFDLELLPSIGYASAPIPKYINYA